MNLNRQYVTHKKRVTKYRELAESLQLECPLCKGHSQTIVSLVVGYATIDCNSCGYVWEKEVEEVDV